MTFRKFVPLLLFLAALLVLWFGAMAVLASITQPNKPAAVAGEQFATIDGGTIRYQMAGDGERVVLFLHGFNSNLNMWDSQWAQLETCPVRRLRLDVPGFGASRFETDDYGLSAQADRIDALLETLDAGKVTVVGISMGGSLAVSLAARHPERVEQLVLLAPSGYPGSLRRSGLFGFLTRPGIARQGANWLAGTHVYKTLFPGSVAMQATTVTASYGPAWLEQLKITQAPAFIAWSRGDRTSHVDTAQNVADAMPDSTLLWLAEDAGHGIHAARPKLVSELACLMGQGVSAHDVAGKLSADALRAGDGGTATTGSLPVE